MNRHVVSTAASTKEPIDAPIIISTKVKPRSEMRRLRTSESVVVVIETVFSVDRAEGAGVALEIITLPGDRKGDVVHFRRPGAIRSDRARDGVLFRHVRIGAEVGGTV